jgi:hypothetical protein
LTKSQYTLVLGVQLAALILGHEMDKMKLALETYAKATGSMPVVAVRLGEMEGFQSGPAVEVPSLE